MKIIKFSTTKINGLEWMTKNLDIDDKEGGITQRVINKCPVNYYTWDAAQRIAKSLGNGWRLPLVSDFIEVVKKLDDNKRRDPEDFENPRIYNIINTKYRLKLSPTGLKYYDYEFVYYHGNKSREKVYKYGSNECAVYWTGAVIHPNGIDKPCSPLVFIDCQDSIGSISRAWDYHCVDTPIRLVRDLK